MAPITAPEGPNYSISAQMFAAEGRRPSGFLSLAPTTSASYPVRKVSATPEVAAAKTTEEVPVPAAVAPAPPSETLHRRSSSTSTAGEPVGVRFLKLGPVHWGEGDGKGDWSEAAISE